MISKNSNQVSKIFNNIIISLQKNNIRNPDIEAKIIISSASDKDNFTSVSHQDLNTNKINFIVKERLKGIPLAKIIKQKGFWNDIFYTNKNTLDPRPDSEVLVESILQDYEFMKTKKIHFIDLCSGTGCLGLSLLGELLYSQCLFIDVCNKAMKVNQINSELLNLKTRSNFLISDLLTNFSLSLRNIEFIISNPPYIRTADIEDLSTETRHDPLLALNGGYDGCDFYRLIITQLKNLKYKGYLYLEIDPIVKDKVVKLVLENNAKVLYIKRDYLELDRIIKIIFL